MHVFSQQGQGSKSLVKTPRSDLHSHNIYKLKADAHERKMMFVPIIQSITQII